MTDEHIYPALGVSLDQIDREAELACRDIRIDAQIQNSWKKIVEAELLTQYVQKFEEPSSDIQSEWAQTIQKLTPILFWLNEKYSPDKAYFGSRISSRLELLRESLLDVSMSLSSPHLCVIGKQKDHRRSNYAARELEKAFLDAVDILRRYYPRPKPMAPLYVELSDILKRCGIKRSAKMLENYYDERHERFGPSSVNKDDPRDYLTIIPLKYDKLCLSGGSFRLPSHAATNALLKQCFSELASALPEYIKHPKSGRKKNR